jgi:glycine cleavage system aminomethyltransferase T
VGRVTDLVWSPRLQRNIGYVWVPAELAGPGNDLEIEWGNGERTPAKTATIPFLDPHKNVPAAQRTPNTAVKAVGEHRS